MKKKLLSLVLVGSFAFSMAACGTSEAPVEDTTVAENESQAEQADLPAELQDGVLSVGMEIGYPPFEYYAEDGSTPVGFDVEMANAIAEELGVEVEFVDTAFDAIFAGLDTDKYDCAISGITVTDDRKASYAFTDSYIGNAQCICVLPGASVKPDSLEALSNLKIAYQGDTTTDEVVTKLIDEGTIECEVFEYDKVLNCFDDLGAGRVDAVVCDSTVASDFIKDGSFEMCWMGASDETMAICTKQSATDLTTVLNDTLHKVYESGKLQEISNNNFGADLVSEMFQAQ